MIGTTLEKTRSSIKPEASFCKSSHARGGDEAFRSSSSFILWPICRYIGHGVQQPRSAPGSTVITGDPSETVRIAVPESSCLVWTPRASVARESFTLRFRDQDNLDMFRIFARSRMHPSIIYRSGGTCHERKRERERALGSAWRFNWITVNQSALHRHHRRDLSSWWFASFRSFSLSAARVRARARRISVSERAIANWNGGRSFVSSRADRRPWRNHGVRRV